MGSENPAASHVLSRSRANAHKSIDHPRTNVGFAPDSPPYSGLVFDSGTRAVAPRELLNLALQERSSKRFGREIPANRESRRPDSNRGPLHYEYANGVSALFGGAENPGPSNEFRPRQWPTISAEFGRLCGPHVAQRRSARGSPGPARRFRDASTKWARAVPVIATRELLEDVAQWPATRELLTPSSAARHPRRLQEDELHQLLIGLPSITSVRARTRLSTAVA
jgi:hypothetical protein